MRQVIDRLGIKGSVLVIKHNRTWLKYATANKPDTSYLINSVQKSLTAALILRDIQNNKLSLDTKLSKYYPNIPGSDQITIANMLSMRSGLHFKKKQVIGTKKFISEHNEIQNEIKETYFNPKLLGKWRYTSANYIYLSGIAAKIAHTSYEQLFKKTYNKGLGLENTEFLWENEDKLRAANWVPAYSRRKNGQYKRVKQASMVRDAGGELGAGSIVMSNADLAKAIHAILSCKLINKESRAYINQVQPPAYYNCGFYSSGKNKRANGAGEGYFTFVRANSDGSDMLVIQTNRTYQKDFGPLKDRINVLMKLIMH